MEWFLGLFLIAGMWVWIVPIAFFFIILAFSEHEQNTWAFISVVAFIALFYNSNLIVIPDIPTLLMYFVIYFVSGAVWSIGKWYFLISEKARQFGEIKLEFIQYLNKNQLDLDDAPAGDLALNLEVDINTRIPKDFEDSFKEFVAKRINTWKDASYTLKEIVIPRAADYKYKITTWILWWPTSLFWTILNDPLVKLANAIYDRFQGIYARISNAVFANKGL